MRQTDGVNMLSLPPHNKRSFKVNVARRAVLNTNDIFIFGYHEKRHAYYIVANNYSIDNIPEEVKKPKKAEPFRPRPH